jgi:hypothetical protein
VKRANPDPLGAECEGGCLFAQKHFTVEWFDKRLGKHQTHLVLGEQPVPSILINLYIFVLTKCLAPASEIGGVTLKVAF